MFKRVAGFAFLIITTAAAQQYTLGLDSQPHADAPHGTVQKFSWTSQGGVYPGIQRDYWVYVPAQYSAAKPACLLVVQDGGGAVNESGDWRYPVVLDNLIAQGAIPVTVGVFVNPGVLPQGASDLPPLGEQASGLPPLGEQASGLPPLYNRSFEYDSVDGRYARFLVDELLPEIKKHWNISEDPNDRSIGGASSGAIAAFTAAMLRPDAFRRVLSFIGSYANLRGGNQWPGLIRKLEPVGLRVFLQDGDHDLNIFAGNWWLANQEMANALEYRGYEFKFAAGTEGHNGKHGGAILPDALRWLWEGWPKPIGTPRRQPNPPFADIDRIVEPGSDWELAGDGYGFTEGPAVDRDGNVFFVDVAKSRMYKVDARTGKVGVFRENTGGASGLMFGRDGRLYAAQNGSKRIVAYEPDGRETVLAENTGSNDLAVSSRGAVYFTDPSTKHVWLIDPGGSKRAVNSDLQFPNGVRFSADERMLFVADSATRWVWSYQVQPDGSLANGEPFYRLELPLAGDGKLVNSWADGMTFDTDGYLYVATKAGIQICDQAGRVFGILRKPSEADPSNVVFGGPDFHTLYVTARDKVFRRRLQHAGYLPWQAPKWPKPQL